MIIIVSGHDTGSLELERLPFLMSFSFAPGTLAGGGDTQGRVLISITFKMPPRGAFFFRPVP